MDFCRCKTDCLSKRCPCARALRRCQTRCFCSNACVNVGPEATETVEDVDAEPDGTVEDVDATIQDVDAEAVALASTSTLPHSTVKDVNVERKLKEVSIIQAALKPSFPQNTSTKFTKVNHCSDYVQQVL
jgi:hypothetical protein